MKYCEYCGEENEKELVFCKKCGANLNYEAVAEHSTIKKAKARDKQKTKVKKVTKKKKVKNRTDSRTSKNKPEVVRKMSFGQKCLMFIMSIIIIVLSSIIAAFLYYQYTHRDNGDTIEVPDVVGMTYEEAYEVLIDANLSVTKETQITELTEEVGIVLKQTPKKGKKTKEKTKIKLIVGMEDDSYEVPNFVGMDARNAIEQLKYAGVSYKITAYNSNHTSGLNDGVVETQSIEAGKKMKKDETIILSISEVIEQEQPTEEVIPTPDITP